jgi:metallophosphoesterase (TIGR00282 family)
MNILYVGDVMGDMGIRVVEQLLPNMRRELRAGLVIAQAENVTDGRGIMPADYERLKKAGVDFFTGGNWSLHHKQIYGAMNDPNQPIIRPANYPEGTPGLGWKYVRASEGPVLVISLLGQIVGRDSDKPTDNPLHVVDTILHAEADTEKSAVVVNFHGDFSSEKVIIGHYLDGRVSAVIGDHWHVPTADARVLPNGTAHITDVGMCGALDSSLGIALETVIPRWRDGIQNRNVLTDAGKSQFNAVLISTLDSGHAKSITHLQELK